VKTDTIRSLDEAIRYFDEMLEAHPERNILTAHEAALAGKKRSYPVITINHLVSPDDTDEPRDDLVLPQVDMPAGPKADLAREIIGLLEPLKMLNPVAPAFGLGVGPGTMVTCFGIALNPEAVNCPAHTRTMDEVLSEPPPDPATAGLLTDMHRRIDLIREYTPERFKIRLPDMQGPFNLAHAIVGEEALVAPYLEPGKFRALMGRITDLWIGARRALLDRIGEARQYPTDRLPMICECSVNLVSPELYKEFMLPCDIRIGSGGPVRIHPCSGPHVFRVTLANVPHVAWTEAGYIAKTAAGSISVDEALEAISDRGIVLEIGQELPEGDEYDFIKKDLDRYRRNPRLLFGYTGMHWRKKDRSPIRDIHRRLDGYWARRYTS
jgi:hypothetical protein